MKITGVVNNGNDQAHAHSGEVMKEDKLVTTLKRSDLCPKHGETFLNIGNAEKHFSMSPEKSGEK